MDIRYTEPSEREIQSAILDYLHAKKIFAWRNNTGATKIGDHFVRFGMKGSSDIIGVLPDGRFLAIEVKRRGKKPTPDQTSFLNQVKKNGGVAFVATSVDDVVAQGI